MELNKVICGDCLDVMRTMPDKCIDLVLTDPPYGIGEAAGKNKSRGCLCKPKDYGNLNWDNEIPSREIFDEMFRVSKNQIIFGGNYFVEYLHNSPCWIVWDKENGNTDFADCELAWTSFKTAVRKIKWRWHGMLQQPGVKKENRYHPTQKPLGVFEWILNKYSKEGDVILDPFIGSGTTAVAAKQLNRNFIGIEKEQAYCDIAKKRLSAVQPVMIS